MTEGLLSINTIFLIRIAYIRFNDDPKLPIENRVKMLFDILKNYFKGKRKTSLDMSINAAILIDPKLRYFDSILDQFISNHYPILNSLFTEFYKYNCTVNKPFRSYDMTITHDFFYKNSIVLKNSNTHFITYIFS